MVFAKNFLFKIKPSNTKKKLDDDKRASMHESHNGENNNIKKDEEQIDEEPESPLPEIDQNMPQAPVGKARFIDLLIASK